MLPYRGGGIAFAKSSDPAAGEKVESWEAGPGASDVTLGKKAIEKGIYMGEPAGTGNAYNTKGVALYNQLSKVSSGTIKATITPAGAVQDASGVAFVLGFDDSSKKYITVGYNAQGWYWENYHPGGDYLKNGIKPVPKEGEKLALILDFDFSTGKITLICNGTKIMNNETVTGMTASQAGKIGFCSNGKGVAVEIVDIELPGVSREDVVKKENYTFPNGSELGKGSFEIRDLVNEFTAVGNADSAYALYKPADAMDRTGGGQFAASITPRTLDGGDKLGMIFGLKDSGKYAALVCDQSSGKPVWFMETKGVTGAGRVKAATGPALQVDIETPISITYDTKSGKVSASSDWGAIFQDEALPGLTELAGGRVGVLVDQGAEVKLSDVMFTELPYIPDAGDLKSYTNTFDDAASIQGYKNYIADKISTFAVEDGKFKWGNNALAVAVDENSPKVLDSTYEIKVTFNKPNTLPQFPPDTAEGRFGLVLRASDKDNWVSANYDLNGRWTVVVTKDGVPTEKEVASGVMPLAPGQEYAFKVKLVGDKISMWCDGTKIFAADLPVSVDSPGYFGFRKWYASETLTIDDVKIQEIYEAPPEDQEEKRAILTTDRMQVTIDQSFPRVIEYAMNNGPHFFGQAKQLSAMEINGVTYFPTTTCSLAADNPNKAVYLMQIKDADEGLDSVITSELSAEGNTVTYRITGVQNNGKTLVHTIFIPEFSLISVRSTQPGANFQGSFMTTNVTAKGDIQVTVDENLDPASLAKGYMYGFVSDHNLSAGIWSNSEEGFNAGAATDYTRVRLSAETVKDAVSGETYHTVGLGSGVWTYQGEGMPAPDKELPCAKVVIASDSNQDQIVDWQDGAVAYRSIMHNPLGSEEVPNQVAQRIVMNFGSTAANPFLKTLDNLKRVSLATDNLGQKILLKGYQNEGHDSAHPDFDDIGERIGGAKDMNTLISEGRKYNAGFGVHINATEMYAEADAFEQSLVKGGFGWDWIDAAYGIDTMYDLTSGKRQQRLEAMKAVIPDLDMVYVDAWYGSNYENTQISKQLNGLGYPVSSEWAYALSNDSLWSHWATDKNYGGFKNKGINSDVARFIGNHQKDLWVMAGLDASHPDAGGYTEFYMPLLGGYDLRGFEGWQKNRDYANYLEVLFNTNLPTKFLQHYEVQSWEHSANANIAGGLDDKEIRLSDGKSTVVSKRVNASSNERVITLDGNVILEDKRGKEEYAYSRYLIPWNWDPSGEAKLYHWNYTGGTSEWTLPEDWKVGEVLVYRLTDEGRQDEATVAVNDGKIILKAEPKTPYVIYRKKAAPTEVTYGYGEHVADPGFNSKNLKAWEVAGSGAAVKEDGYRNPRVEFTNMDAASSISQTITDLVPGKKYTALVYVDNQSSTAKAAITVECAGTAVTNYTNKTIAQNFVKSDAHSSDNVNNKWVGGMLTMQVSFTVPADAAQAKLTLSREADATGAPSYFDDIRIVETGSDYYPNSDFVFEQDFEHSEKGIYPFVHGGIEGTEDNRTHLSERHDPYTSKGFNPKGMGAQLLDDVISGNWSVKSHALRANGLAYQTVPQNFRFEPDVKYLVSFDYQAGNPGGFEFITGTGEFSGKKTDYKTVKLDERNTTRVSFEVTGDKSGDTWVGIYRTNVYNPQNLKDAPTKFGENDFILDNLRISKTIASNLSFEDNKKEAAGDKILSWKESISAPKAGISTTIQYFANAKDGQFVLGHNNKAAFEVANEQTVENLPAGTYKLGAWTKSSGGISSINVSVGDKVYTKAIPANNAGKAPSKPEGAWTEVVLDDIIIPEGTAQAVISLHTKDEAGGGWTIFDDIQFYKYTPSAPIDPDPPVSGGGSSSSSGGGGSTVIIMPDKPIAPEGNWNNIENAISAAKVGDTIKVNAKGKESIPSNLLAALKGKDITVILDMDAYSWKINGKAIAQISDAYESIRLDVKQINSADIVKSAKAQGLAKGQVMQFEIGHNGELPFKAELTLNIGMSHVGDKVNLSYYNPATKKLEARAASTVSEKGLVALDFTHASQYIITLEKPSFASVITGKTLYKGQSYTLKPKDLVKGAKVKFSSSKKAVAAIDAKGRIKAVSTGKAVITTKITESGKTYTYTTAVTVKAPKITLTKKTASMKAGESYQFAAKQEGLAGKVVWVSSSKEIATVSGNGKVQAKKAGKVTITAKSGKTAVKNTITVK